MEVSLVVRLLIMLLFVVHGLVISHTMKGLNVEIVLFRNVVRSELIFKIPIVVNSVPEVIITVSNTHLMLVGGHVSN